jgi:hypothetical protein
MNCFQLVKRILDETYEKIPGSPEAKNAAVKEALGVLSGEYSHLLSGGTVKLDYASPAVRFAYMFAYVTSHTCIVYDAFDLSKDLQAVVNKEKATISCIGGGPGSDFLGVMRYVMNRGLKPRLRFNMFDRERAWSNTWDYVEDKIDKAVPISTAYNQFDVTDPNTWRAYDKFLASDLFTMIYFMSEVWGLRTAAEPFFEYFLAGASKGALVLYVDNRVSEFTDWFDRLAAQHGWEPLLQEAADFVPPPDEEKNDLGEYLKMFDWSPKLKTRVDIRVARKK